MNTIPRTIPSPKGFRCGYAEKRTLTFKDGIVTYMGNNVQSNWSDWARPILLKAL